MSLNINKYIADGFVKICKVSGGNHWQYYEQNESLMYSSHNSWVYVICVDDTIVKLGETGNPLGIRNYWFTQPITGSKSRLGRYMTGDGTDRRIREELASEVKQGKVSIWARACKTVLVENQIAGRTVNSLTTVHRALELQYLDYIRRTTGGYPRLNKSRK